MDRVDCAFIKLCPLIWKLLFVWFGSGLEFQRHRWFEPGGYFFGCVLFFVILVLSHYSFANLYCFFVFWCEAVGRCLQIFLLIAFFFTASYWLCLSGWMGRYSAKIAVEGRSTPTMGLPLIHNLFIYIFLCYNFAGLTSIFPILPTVFSKFVERSSRYLWLELILIFVSDRSWILILQPCWLSMSCYLSPSPSGVPKVQPHMIILLKNIRRPFKQNRISFCPKSRS